MKLRERLNRVFLDGFPRETAMKGGKDGLVIVPADSAGSLLVQIQAGQHFGQLTSDELKLVKFWIDGGALEK